MEPVVMISIYSTIIPITITMKEVAEHFYTNWHSPMDDHSKLQNATEEGCRAVFVWTGRRGTAEGH